MFPVNSDGEKIPIITENVWGGGVPNRIENKAGYMKRQEEEKEIEIEKLNISSINEESGKE